MPSPLLLAFFVARAARFRLRQPRPADDRYLKVVGPDPARVLITGAGVAAGYGVERHRDGLAGPLSELLAERLGRGVVVEVRAAAVLPMHRATGFLGPTGAHTFDAVVFAPCFLEGQLPPTPAWGRHVQQVVAHLRSTGSGWLTVLLTGVPRPSAAGPVDRAVAEAADAANAAIEALAGQHSRVRYTPVPAFGSVHEARPFDAAYYRGVAEVLAEELVPGLERRSARA